ncbi:MAG TPA: TonB-dependent receptor [Bacteroidetes bacterium]|nr:TonB-dependent receptor [Bacteroidota bacterium]
MAKNFTLFFLGLLLSVTTFAQTSSVTGKVLDPDGNAAPFANVLLYNTADSALVKAGYSNNDGKYILGPVTAGNYFTRVSFTGYANYESSAFDLKKGEKLSQADIKMVEVSTSLKDVQIVAHKAMVTIKPDMTVFNVEGTANAIGENAFDLLRKAPGVVVDNNDNVMLLGKSGVRVYIDGKPSPLSATDLANMLRGMQSDQIESYEIITNPSSKYDAEGNAGIINIKMKRDKNLGANATLNLGYAIGIHPKYNGSVSANYRSKKFNAFGSYGANAGKRQNFMDSHREQFSTAFDQTNIMISEMLNHNFRGGVDFFLGKKHTIGLLVNGFLAAGDFTTENRTKISDLSSGSPINLLVADGVRSISRKNINSNANYRYDDGKGVSLNLDADYGTFDLQNNAFQPNIYYDPSGQNVILERNFKTQAPTLIDIYTFKADYERPLWKGKLGLGGKYSYVTTNNTFNFFDLIGSQEIKDTARSNSFLYTENINAAYLNYQRQFGKWGLMAGVRAEQTNSVGDLTSTQQHDNSLVERHYLNFFPSAGITYSPGQKNMFRLNYSRRIDRPKYENLNPFEFQLNEQSFRKGNPFLQPQYTHNVQFTHTYKYTLNTTVSYSHTNNFFTNITDVEDSVATYITMENLKSQKVASIAVSYPRQITKWWSTFTNTSLSNVRNQANLGENRVIDISQTTFNVFHQSTFNIPWGIRLQLSGWYNSASLWGANFRTNPLGTIEAGLIKNFMKDRATLKLALSDIFFTQQWNSHQVYGDLDLRVNGGWESRQVKVNFTYLFGNNKVKSARKRKTGLDDEKDRAGGSGNGGR